jgi:hypothetical protein
MSDLGNEPIKCPFCGCFEVGPALRAPGELIDYAKSRGERVIRCPQCDAGWVPPRGHRAPK